MTASVPRVVLLLACVLVQNAATSDTPVGLEPALARERTSGARTKSAAETLM